MLEFDVNHPALFVLVGLVIAFVLAPLIFMVALFILVPAGTSAVGLLVPVGALIAIGVSRILYKKGKL